MMLRIGPCERAHIDSKTMHVLRSLPFFDQVRILPILLPCEHHTHALEIHHGFLARVQSLRRHRSRPCQRKVGVWRSDS